MKRTVRSIASFVLSGMVLISCGCGAVGLGVGAIIDSRAPDTKAIDLCQIGLLKPGTKSVTFLRDGSKITGFYQELKKSDYDEYSVKYGEYENQNSGFFLSLGDTVYLGNGPEHGKGVVFSGYDYEPFDRPFRGKKYPGSQCQCLLVIDESMERQILIKDLMSLHMNPGMIIPARDIKLRSSKWELPLRSEIVLDADGSHKRVRFVDISIMEVERKKRAKYYGLILGLAVDIVLLVNYVDWAPWATKKAVAEGLDE